MPGSALAAPSPHESSALVRWSVNAVAAAVVLGVFWLPPAMGADDPWHRAVGLSLAAFVGVAMLVRERLPTLVVAGVGLATLGAMALGVTEDFMLAVAWCLYPLAVRRAASARRLVIGLVAVLLVVLAVSGVPDDSRQVAQWMVLSVAAPGVAWLLGTAVGRRIEVAAEAARVAARLEVARDVHDVVGHALGLLSAEAGVARSLPDADEDELREALADIEVRARGTLEDVQGLVGALRTSSSDAPDQGGLASRLQELVARTRGAGVHVEALIEVDERVDEATSLVVFRIVQEALANTVRHAPGAPCTVVVGSEGSHVSVRVRDRGPGAGGTEPGYGLTGMRERATLVGGTVDWADHPAGGFEVLARLPATRQVSTSG
ncbi:sensor histidine kinase [Cellulomonas wangsupingiae]|uniref:histidine kinase n=1 Tax=Cellulomonas wangsupingiae TaxID=2968085 RepID=A0ABY5K833_9CELL|nr:sensor histidine kinase [Cellulomonas wangsupingiae]MCC2335062.1 sensor histidine kinase [Cellulomonas wangsupingiae]UUI65561.1 sensor histidine kinase [Cellulomonas wangsupingiae]